MSLLLDAKYVCMLSDSLERFTDKGRGLYNCRCPICGDSEKSSFRARGYFIPSDTHYTYYCHNCGASMALRNFLQVIESSLFDQYCIETFTFQEPRTTDRRLKPFTRNPLTLDDIPNSIMENVRATHAIVDKLNAGEQDAFDAYEYVMQRMQVFSARILDDAYYTSNLKELAFKLFPDLAKDKELPETGLRVVFPLRDRRGYLNGIQTRAVDPHDAKKHILVARPGAPKLLWGLDKVDTSQPIYVTEGIFDAACLPNSIAKLDSALSHVGSEVSGDLIMVHDNEPRNIEIVKQMRRSIAKGYKVVIWPTDIHEKDVNEMFNKMFGKKYAEYIAKRITKRTNTGMKTSFFEFYFDECVENHIYQGLKAELEFNRWAKV